MDFFRDLKQDLVEFCSTTSIQGMRNVTDQKQAYLFRIIWLIIVITSFVLSGICIKESIDGNNLFVVLDYLLHLLRPWTANLCESS